ncbi:MAG: hypothetical protein ACK4UY_15775 [Dietzia sp.]
MKVAAAGLIALPLVVGGLGIAAAVVVLGPPEATAPPDDEMTEEIASRGSGESTTRDGTAIEGSRPHLTVRAGTPTVMIAGTIPGFLALLPATANTLPALAPFTSATAQPGGSGTGPRTGPAPAPVGGPTPTAENLSAAPSPAPDSRNSAPTRDSPAGQTVDGGSVRATAVGGPALLTTGTSAERPTSGYAAGGPPANRTPPPHAAETGRPDHAGTTGPPPHASAEPRGNGALRDYSRSDTRPSPE